MKPKAYLITLLATLGVNTADQTFAAPFNIPPPHEWSQYDWYNFCELAFWEAADRAASAANSAVGSSGGATTGAMLTYQALAGAGGAVKPGLMFWLKKKAENALMDDDMNAFDRYNAYYGALRYDDPAILHLYERDLRKKRDKSQGEPLEVPAEKKLSPANQRLNDRLLEELVEKDARYSMFKEKGLKDSPIARALKRETMELVRQLEVINGEWKPEGAETDENNDWWFSGAIRYFNSDGEETGRPTTPEHGGGAIAGGGGSNGGGTGSGGGDTGKDGAKPSRYSVQTPDGTFDFNDPRLDADLHLAVMFKESQERKNDPKWRWIIMEHKKVSSSWSTQQVRKHIKEFAEGYEARGLPVKIVTMKQAIEMEKRREARWYGN